MPVIELLDTEREAPESLIDFIRKAVQKALDLTEDKVWIFRRVISRENALCNIWNLEEMELNNAPIVFVNCKSLYTAKQISLVLKGIERALVEQCNCSAENIFIGVRRFAPGELFINGKIYY